MTKKINHDNQTAILILALIWIFGVITGAMLGKMSAIEQGARVEYYCPGDPVPTIDTDTIHL